MIPETKIESDREFVKFKVCEHIDRFFDDFKHCNIKLMESEKTIEKLEYKRKILARGYAVNIGVLLTRKQFEKLNAHRK